MVRLVQKMLLAKRRQRLSPCYNVGVSAAEHVASCVGWPLSPAASMGFRAQPTAGEPREGGNTASSGGTSRCEIHSHPQCPTDRPERAAGWRQPVATPSPGGSQSPRTAPRADSRPSCSRRWTLQQRPGQHAPPSRPRSQRRAGRALSGAWLGGQQRSELDPQRLDEAGGWHGRHGISHRSQSVSKPVIITSRACSLQQPRRHRLSARALSVTPDGMLYA